MIKSLNKKMTISRKRMRGGQTANHELQDYVQKWKTDYRNYPLAAFDTRRVTDMTQLFENVTLPNAAFDGIASWDVSNVERMSYMFRGATHFDQPIHQWNMRAVRSMKQMLVGTNITATKWLGLWTLQSCIPLQGIIETDKIDWVYWPQWIILVAHTEDMIKPYLGRYAMLMVNRSDEYKNEAIISMALDINKDYHQYIGHPNQERYRHWVFEHLVAPIMHHQLQTWSYPPSIFKDGWADIEMIIRNHPPPKVLVDEQYAILEAKVEEVLEVERPRGVLSKPRRGHYGRWPTLLRSDVGRHVYSYLVPNATRFADRVIPASIRLSNQVHASSSSAFYRKQASRRNLSTHTAKQLLAIPPPTPTS